MPKWTEKFFECENLNKKYGIDPTSLNKEKFWKKPETTKYDDQDKASDTRP